MRNILKCGAVGGGVLVTALVVASGAVSQQQPASGPIARYSMDAGTVSGMEAMGGGMGGGMSMMFGGGGGNKIVHELFLKLGSSSAPEKGGPKADHFMPSSARLGKSVPLITPKQAPVEEALPRDFERPKGRLLVYWGCGAHVGKGQPVVIDFAKVAAGQMPPGLMSAAVPRDTRPTVANSRTYGDWPNGRDRKMLSGDSSLIGDHRIAGNYAPEIRFALNQDFLSPINGRTTGMSGGPTTISWNGVPGATGYYAWVMGMKMSPSGEPGDMVWWSSSATREFGGGLWEWLSPGTVQRLIGQKIVMPPSQTSCALPVEVKQAAPDMQMGFLYAYGPEQNFAYPPRPANPKQAWNLEWTARVRYRSHTSFFINAPGGMGGMGGSGGESAPKCRGGMFGAVLGGC